MTRDQLIALTAACPVTLEHAAVALGRGVDDLVKCPTDRQTLFAYHADMVADWIAAMATEMVNIEAEQSEE